MVTNRDYYIHQIWELIRANIGDDDSLDERLIGAWIDGARELVLSNELNKNKFGIDESLVQEVKTDGVAFVALENSNVGIHSVEIFAPTKRTVLNIPEPIYTHNGTGFTRIGPVDKSSPKYAYTSIHELPYAGNGRFSEKAIKAFYWEGKVYLFTRSTTSIDFKLLKNISVRGIFRDPTSVPGYSDEEEYPISGKMFQYMKTILMESNYKIIMNAKSDEINDSVEN